MPSQITEKDKIKISKVNLEYIGHSRSKSINHDRKSKIIQNPSNRSSTKLFSSSSFEHSKSKKPFFNRKNWENYDSCLPLRDILIYKNEYLQKWNEISIENSKSYNKKRKVINIKILKLIVLNSFINITYK